MIDSQPEVLLASDAPENLTQKAAAGAGWSSLATVARQVLSIAAVAVLAHGLGPAAYGLMGMATTVTAFMSNLRDLGTAAAIIQRPTISQALLSTVFWANVILGLILSLLLLLLSGPLAAFFHEPELAALLRVLAASFVLMSAGIVHNAILNRAMLFKYASIADFASAFVGYAVAITMVIMGCGVWSLVYSSLAASFTLTSMYWYFSGWKPSLSFSSNELWSVARFSLNFSGFGLVNYFARNADNLVVGRYLGAQPLGQYQMAYNLMMYPIQNVTSLLCQVLLPAFSKIQDDNKRFADAYLRSCSLIALVTFPVIAGLGVVAKPLALTLLGVKWLPVVPIFQILAPIGLVQSVQSTVGQIYVAKGRTDLMLRMGLFAAVVFVSAFLVGVRYGVLGVATAYGIGYFGVVLYPAFAIPFRLIDLSVLSLGRELSPLLAITGAMVAACAGWLWLLSSLAVTNSWFQLLSAVLVGGATYVFLVLRTRPRVIFNLANILSQADSGLARRGFLLLRRVAAV